MKGKGKGLQKRNRAANNVLSTGLWHLHNFDATPIAERIIIGEKYIGDKYDYVLMNYTTWYVRRQENSLYVGSYTYKTCFIIEKSVNKPVKRENWETIFRPRFKCVNTVKLMNGLLNCTFKHYDQIGIVCHHFLRITDVGRECFDIRWWLYYQHYFLQICFPTTSSNSI